jgi:hypothetical protein
MTGSAFHESAIRGRPIRDLGLRVEGTWLEGVVAKVLEELRAAGVKRLRPRFYLSTEWGVATGSVAVAIPFYLADRRLTELHAQRAGLVEGSDEADILKYMRHELGHVLNYAHQLYEDPEWVELFGSFTQPYLEDYRPEPFSRRFVRHLPGWYAQKHPDEDWSETFAVWLTPGHDWRSEYAGWPEALAKLEWCDARMRVLGDVEPRLKQDSAGLLLDEEVGEIAYSLEDYWQRMELPPEPLPEGLAGALRSVFDDLPSTATADCRPAADLMRRLERDLVSLVFRWTGHFPERTLVLLRHLAARAEAESLAYAAENETQAAIALTALVTSLAMNHVHRGTYLS